MVKIHLDTDIGGDVDDLCALAMLLRWPGVDITGITTTAEENGRRAGYVRYVLALENCSHIPVAAGADVAFGGYRYELGYPPEVEYWPEPIPPAPGPVDNALALLRQSIEQNAIIVGIGPYTNLRLLDQQHPGILQRAQLVLMGGYVSPPRAGFPAWDHEMDFNVQVDVASAVHVLENADPLLVPLNMTVETAIRRAYLGKLEKSGPMGQLIARQVRIHGEAWENERRHGRPWCNTPDDLLNFQHDPLTCAIALQWNTGVTVERVPLRVDVNDGWVRMSVDESGKPTRLVTQIDGAAFNEFWLRTITQSTG